MVAPSINIWLLLHLLHSVDLLFTEHVVLLFLNADECSTLG